MAGALVAAVILGWASALGALLMGAPVWFALLLLPTAGCPVLVLGALLAAYRPAPSGLRLAPIRG